MRSLLIALALLITSPAVAWESWLDESQARVSYSTDGYEYRLRRSGYRPRQYQHRQRRRYYEPTYSYAAPKHSHTSSDYGSSATCYSAIRVVGSQWKDEEGAEESARKGWMEAVRWKHGEHAMDIGGARSYVRRCSRSSIGSVLGETLHRCEVEAKPCRPKFEDGK
jgi:LmbE family N-acetylglucosaminyl deacetylase